MLHVASIAYVTCYPYCMYLCIEHVFLHVISDAYLGECPSSLERILGAPLDLISPPPTSSSELVGSGAASAGDVSGRVLRRAGGAGAGGAIRRPGGRHSYHGEEGALHPAFLYALHQALHHTVSHSHHSS